MRSQRKMWRGVEVSNFWFVNLIAFFTLQSVKRILRLVEATRGPVSRSSRLRRPTEISWEQCPWNVYSEESVTQVVIGINLSLLFDLGEMLWMMGGQSRRGVNLIFCCGMVFGSVCAVLECPYRVASEVDSV